MSRIKSLMVCGLIATVGSGCQTARSVTSHVAGWRPFGGSTAVESEALAEAAEQDDEARLDELKTELASAEEEMSEAAPAEEPAPAEDVIAAVDSEIPAVPEEEELSDFAAFAAQLEAEQAAEQVAAETATIESDAVESDVVAEQADFAADAIAKADAPAVSTESAEAPSVETDALASQIEQLLAQYEPASDAPQDKSTAVEQVEAAEPQSAEVAAAAVEAESKSVPVKTAGLKQKKDASLIAYDLASFADVSVKRDVAASIEKSAKQAQPVNDFAAWAQETAATAEEQTTAAVKAADSDFPWAGAVAQTAEQAVPTEKKAELLIDEASDTVEAAAEPALAEAKADVEEAREQALMVSSDMLAVLEQALGSENWKNADGIEQRVIKLTPQQQEIRSLTRSEDPQVRLRGIRLAFEQTKGNSPLVGDVARLLTDDSALVRTHAASALYHWNQNTTEAIETLSLVVTSDEERPAQLAAMFLGDMTRETEQVVPVLETALLSTSGMTSMHVAEALLKHDPQNVDAVARLTELMRHENVEVRWLTAHALGSVQGNLQPYAVEALRSGLRDIDSQVRATSALSLGGLGKVSQVAVAELTFISAHGEPKVKDAAHIALECIQQ